MNEDTTQQLPAFEARIMAAIAEMRAEMSERLTAIEGEVAATKDEVAATRQAFHTRISTLEEKADERSRETRPLWEAVLSRLELMDSKFDRLAADLLTTRAEYDMLKKRLPPAA